MRIKILFIFLAIFFVFSTSVYSQSTFTAPKPYNKPLAIFLSVVSPGMGQVYSGQVTKGMTIWTSSVFLAGALFVTVGDLNFYSSGSTIPLNIGFDWKEEFSPSERTWGWIFASTYAALYIYNILDISLYDPNKISVEVSQNSFHTYYNIRF